MQANGLLKFLTGAVAVGLVGIIGYEVANQTEPPVEVASDQGRITARPTALKPARLSL